MEKESKIFSQNDMIEFMQFIVSNEELENTSSVHKSTAKHYLDEFCNSKQKIEWNVEILMKKMNIDEIREQGKGFLNASTENPKLDANGCLILKSVE